MATDYSALRRIDVLVDAKASQGPLELWRHTLGQGGINALPLPQRVVEGVKKLRPRLIRVFVQEHFNVYPEHGRFDWSKLDPFMDALAQTGAKVVAAISIKPPVLFPTVDQAIWRPTDWGEWQKVIFELVKRYSVEKPIVTYWEVGNETDIGEGGGCPYLIPNPTDYAEYYSKTVRPISEAFPDAKVGGPAACWVTNEPLPGLVNFCRTSGTQLDFISWHIYHDDPKRHAAGVAMGEASLADFPGKRPEMLVTEWNKSFDPVSCEDMALEPRRAADAAACILAMLDAGLDWSFYYHIWDQTFYPEAFEQFFSAEGITKMAEHWNEAPHRFGLFGVGEAVRPQYFLYQMLSVMGEERLAAESEDADLRSLAGRGEGRVAVLLTNFNLERSRDALATVHFSHLAAGRKLLTVCRIDRDRRWDVEELELLPLEKREVYARREFRCSLYSPADSVALVTLEDL